MVSTLSSTARSMIGLYRVVLSLVRTPRRKDVGLRVRSRRRKKVPSLLPGLRLPSDLSDIVSIAFSVPVSGRAVVLLPGAREGSTGRHRRTPRPNDRQENAALRNATKEEVEAKQPKPARRRTRAVKKLPMDRRTEVGAGGCRRRKRRRPPGYLPARRGCLRHGQQRCKNQ